MLVRADKERIRPAERRCGQPALPCLPPVNAICPVSASVPPKRFVWLLANGEGGAVDSAERFQQQRGVLSRSPDLHPLDGMDE